MRLSDGRSEKRESWDKGDARELETFCARALRSFPSSPSRASRLSRKREVIPPLSFIINSNFPTKWSRATGDEAGVGYLFRPRRHQMGYPDIFDNEWKVFRPHYLSRVLFFPNACMVASARASYLVHAHCNGDHKLVRYINFLRPVFAESRLKQLNLFPWIFPP